MGYSPKLHLCFATSWAACLFVIKDQLTRPELYCLLGTLLLIKVAASLFFWFLLVRVKYNNPIRAVRFLDSVDVDPEMNLRRCTLSEWLARLRWPEPQSLAVDDRSCCLCLEPYSWGKKSTGSDEIPVRLTCGHTFGLRCIGRWLSQCKEDQDWGTCPVCRSRLFCWVTIVVIGTDQGNGSETEYDTEVDGQMTESEETTKVAQER